MKVRLVHSNAVICSIFVVLALVLAVLFIVVVAGELFGVCLFVC